MAVHKLLFPDSQNHPSRHINNIFMSESSTPSCQNNLPLPCSTNSVGYCFLTAAPSAPLIGVSSCTLARCAGGRSSPWFGGGSSSACTSTKKRVYSTCSLQSYRGELLRLAQVQHNNDTRPKSVELFYLESQISNTFMHRTDGRTTAACCCGCCCCLWALGFKREMPLFHSLVRLERLSYLVH